jgi:pimeloyl-ACP methyl ester carboxylesterase
MTLAALPRANGKGEGRVRVGSVDIAYDVRGTGEPLLLIPGLAMPRLMWPDELCIQLAQLGFRVVRIDNRDVGSSSRFEARPPDVRKLLGRAFLGLAVTAPYRLEDMAADAFGVMRALGHERFHVAGASMGGMIAQTMAILSPDRLHTMTSVMSGPGGRRYAVGKLAALRALVTPLPRERSAQIDRLMTTFRILNGNDLPFEEPRMRALAEMLADGATSRSASARQLGAIIESMGRRRALLRNVRTPTLVIHGTADPLLPMRGAVATARHIAGAELLVVRGMGHDFQTPVLPLIAGAIATHARRPRSVA